MDILEIIKDVLDGIVDILSGIQTGIENINYLFNQGGIWFEISTAVWNGAINLIRAIMGYTPQEFSDTAWNYTVNTVYSFNLSVGALLLNLMYMTGLLRSCTNLKENLTLEIVLDGLIKIVLANFLMLNGLPLMQSIFRISALMSNGFLSMGSLTFTPFDKDLGAALFMNLFGLIYFLVSLVCSGMVFLSVYGRYMHLYALIGIAPLAWSTIPGGYGISNSASAWIRTFLAKTFEIAIVSIFIGIAGHLCESINFGQLLGAASLFDGAVQILQNMAVMVILAAAVMGSEPFLRKAMAL